MPSLWPGAGDGNRTRVSCLEGRCSTIELHRRICLPAMPNREAGETGIEPAFCWRSVTYGKANCIQRSCGREVCNRILDPYISCKQPDTPFVCPAGLKVPTGRIPNLSSFRLSAKGRENLMQLCVPAAGGEWRDRTSGPRTSAVPPVM